MTTLTDFTNPEAHRQYRRYVEATDETIDESRRIALNTLLTKSRGYENRRSAKALAEHTEVAPSTVRDIVAELRTEFSVPIASLGGYFVIETTSELERVLDAKRQEIETRRERMSEITAAFNGHGAGE